MKGGFGFACKAENGWLDLPSVREEMTSPIYKRGSSVTHRSQQPQRAWYIERLESDRVWRTNEYYSSFKFDIPRAREVVKDVPGLRLVVRQADGTYLPDEAAPRTALVGSKNPFVAYCPECGRSLPNNAERIIQHLKHNHGKDITVDEAHRIGEAPKLAR